VEIKFLCQQHGNVISREGGKIVVMRRNKRRYKFPSDLAKVCLAWVKERKVYTEGGGLRVETGDARTTEWRTLSKSGKH